MDSFNDLKLSKHILRALEDLEFEKPTPVQRESFPVIMSGKDIVGISQTGTGKTLAYVLPILQDLKYSDQLTPRVLILVPTRELVIQLVENVEALTTYNNTRVVGVYGGTNINTQKVALLPGSDIVVATPGRLYDLVMHGALKLKTVKKLVIDEVDIMLDLGFRYQLNNIFQILPVRRQNIMFSATMTDEINNLIHDYFNRTQTISIAVSGTRLENITQSCYPVPNFYTKANLLSHLMDDKETFVKVLVFVSSKKNADRLFAILEEKHAAEMAVIHSNKSQNYRIRSIERFESGAKRMLISTDIMARGLDLTRISHVISLNTPNFPENYIHRIGRTGRAEEKGNSILFYTISETKTKGSIEKLMSYKIPVEDFPVSVAISKQLLPEEKLNLGKLKNYNRNETEKKSGKAFHEKKAKNKKVNLGGRYKREIGKKYKKSQTRGDKIQNRRKKK